MMDAIVTIGFIAAMVVGSWWGIAMLVAAAVAVAAAIFYAAR